MYLPNARFIGWGLSAPPSPVRRALTARAGVAWCSSLQLNYGSSASVPRHRRATKRSYSSHQPGHKKLDLLALDKKWQEIWASTSSAPESAALPTTADDKTGKYVLPMFPYPSGKLHLGHLRVYTIADVVARFYRLQGRDVLLPMGWDSFGLPAENAAIEHGVQPAAWTRSNIAKMKSQLDLMNGSWDWSKELSTCEPDFYKHTQRIFLLLHRLGLAYRAEAEVNYDPVDETVLANEQVDANGCSWRSGAKVEKRLLKQWFLRISAYREALLKDLDVLARDGAWPERVLAMQRNWLGKSHGAVVQFPLLAFGQGVPAALEVFTTRIDTLPGVQYVALAASHKVVQDLADSDPELRAFLDTLPGLPPDSKVGYLLPHLRAVNPLAYHEATPDAAKQSLPVYVAPYVLGDYGEGAVMGVPGHDVRDHAFWRHHRAGEPVRVVLTASEDESTTVLDLEDAEAEAEAAATAAVKAEADEPYVGHGVMTEHSGPFKGRSSKETADMLLAMLEAAGLAKGTVRWRLRDWLISRQRYWGTPIPIIHCPSCGAVPVPEADLPVELPDVQQHFAGKHAGNPLASAHDWVNVPCPQCHGPAKRDTDTMDTFVDSSWYYMRFVDPHNADAPFAADKAKAALPVDVYLGGIEHAILHLLYARFIYKVLMSSSLVQGEGNESAARSTTADGKETEDESAGGPVYEPFARLITQGMVHGKTYIDPRTGRFLKPGEVDATGSAEPRVLATGEPAVVAYEKMSKSKHNGVDPTDTIARYGADATRAHMLFRAPVADVLNWDEETISGVTRWLGRLHDMVVAAAAEHDDGNTSSSSSASETSVVDDLRRRAQNLDAIQGDAAALARWDADSAVWRALQTALASVTASYTRVYSLNTVVSDLMQLTNTLAAHEATSAAAASAATPAVLRAALSALVRMLAPVAPAVAEECWSILAPGQPGLFQPSKDGHSRAVFPVPDGSLAWLQPRLQSCAVQVNGRLRCAVDIPRAPAGLAGDALRDWLVEAILATKEGGAKLAGGEGSGGRDIRRAKKAIVVRDGQLVNFVF